ncbi:hypothetical protein LINPERHAP1_LOCUS30615, partial [Linum perenne]
QKTVRRPPRSSNRLYLHRSADPPLATPGEAVSLLRLVAAVVAAPPCCRRRRCSALSSPPPLLVAELPPPPSSNEVVDPLSLQRQTVARRRCLIPLVPFSLHPPPSSRPWNTREGWLMTEIDGIRKVEGRKRVQATV